MHGREPYNINSSPQLTMIKLLVGILAPINKPFAVVSALQSIWFIKLPPSPELVQPASSSHYHTIPRFQGENVSARYKKSWQFKGVRVRDEPLALNVSALEGSA